VRGDEQSVSMYYNTVLYELEVLNGICYTWWIIPSTGSQPAMTTSSYRQVLAPLAPVYAGGNQCMTRPPALTYVLGGPWTTCTSAAWKLRRAVWRRHSSNWTSQCGSSTLVGRHRTMSVGRQRARWCRGLVDMARVSTWSLPAKSLSSRTICCSSRWLLLGLLTVTVCLTTSRQSSSCYSQRIVCDSLSTLL